MKYLFIFIAIFLLAVLSISAYLAPDGLANCEKTPSKQSRCKKVDAIVAVSGGNTAVRTKEAIRLFHDGWAKYLIFSGAAFDSDSPSNASVMKQQAISAGVPTERIITEDFSRTTHQNAKETKDILKRYDISTLIVVTSPYHQRRAGLEFKNMVGESVLVIDHPAWNDPDWPWYWWVTPRGWWLAVGELAKVGAAHAGGSQ